MTEKHDFEERYLEGDPPWDTGRPDRGLGQTIALHSIRPCKVLEFGCGTGQNAIYLAGLGFDVTAVDISETAIKRAMEGLVRGLEVNFQVANIIDGPIEGGPFEFVFDRGCLHSFDTPSGRMACSKAVAENLADGGLWLTMAGNGDDPDTMSGPPRLTGREILEAVEPSFEVLELKRSRFDSDNAPLIWSCLSRKRS